MPDNIERRPEESDEEYIASLKITLHKLFAKHIQENEGRPEFSSDIDDPKERANWEKQQLAQWNERHAMLEEFVQLGELENDELPGTEYILLTTSTRTHVEKIEQIELRQRWLTEDGKAFLEKIIEGLKKKENQWDEENPTKGLDFGQIILEDGKKKFSDFYYVDQFSARNYRDIRKADLSKCLLFYPNLQGANLKDANLKGVFFHAANLKGINLGHANLKGANLINASLKGAELWSINLQNAELWGANFQDAELWKAKLQNAELHGANLEGTDLGYATIAESKVYNSKDPTNPPILNRSADFSGVTYSLEWRGPLWAAVFMSVATVTLSPFWWLAQTIWYICTWQRPIIQHPLQWKKFAWQRIHDKCIIRRLVSYLVRKIKLLDSVLNFMEKVRNAILKFISKKGRPTKFSGIDTSLMDGSKNPGLKRDIEDEQFIEDFHEKHPVLYWLWARSSDCGRSLSLWAFWSLLIALICGFAYADHDYPDWMPQDGYVEYALCKINPEVTIDFTEETNPEHPLREPSWTTPYYFSIVTFTTLGFGDIKPRNQAAEVWLTLEVVTGYFFLGGLVAILASKLARRS